MLLGALIVQLKKYLYAIRSILKSFGDLSSIVVLVEKSNASNSDSGRRDVMSIIEVFPAALLRPEAKEEFILLLRKLPIDPRRKKETLIDWCKITGVVLTKEMIEAVIGEFARKYEV